MHNYNHFRTFCTVARTLSVSKAAEIHCVTQSAVSHAIRALEERIGTALFHRTGKGLCLTPIGKQLFESIEPAFEKIDFETAQLCRMINTEERTVVISSNHALLAHFFIPCLPLLSERFPKIRFRFLTLPLKGVADAVRSGEADIGCIMYPCADVRDGEFESTELCTMPEILIASRKLINTIPMTLSDWASASFISLPRDSSTHAFFVEHFARYGLSFSPAIEVNQMSLITTLVKKGVGIGVIYRYMLPDIRKTNPEIDQVQLTYPIPERKAALIRRPSATVNTLPECFISTLVEKILSIHEKSAS